MSATNNLVLISSSDLKEIVASAVMEQLQKHLPKERQPFAEFAEYVTKNEVREMCNCSLGTVDNWIKDGRLIPSRNGRVIRFSKKDVIYLLSQKPKHKRV